MNVLIPIAFALTFIILPFFLRKLSQRINLANILSDVVVCFGIGILLGNTKQWWIPIEAYQASAFSVAEISTAGSVLLAIPMLLMTSDIRASARYAPKFLLSFFLCIISVLLATVAVVYWTPELVNLAEVAGCFVGVYIGGTPNMVAISYAVNTPHELFVILNSTDLFCGGIYFLFLTSVGQSFYGLFLPVFSSKKRASKPHDDKKENLDLILDEIPTKTLEPINNTTGGNIFPPKPLNIESLSPLLRAFGLSVLCIGASVGLSFLFPNQDGSLNEMLLMVTLSTFSIALSFYPQIQGLKGVYDFAQYLLLIFAIAVGFMADFSKLADAGTTYLVFNAALVIGLLVIHLILAIIFKIDRDTFIITSTACVFGPPFIGQVCSVIKNKEMLAPGMALGVLGLVIGTYLGIIVTSILL
jgi:uncharacterized membrane protein